MKEKLDIIFSKFIRLRDTDEYGYGECITCGGRFRYKDLEAGHFRHRRHLTTRWLEQNVHAQCFECNRKDDIGAYMIAMLGKYDMEVASEIIAKSKVSYKFTKDEYAEMYQVYRAKVKELLVDKMFIIQY